MTRTARYARLATATVLPGGDLDWDRTSYSPIWEPVLDGATGATITCDSEADAEAEAIRCLTEGVGPHTVPADVVGWGTVIDVEVAHDRIERYAIEVVAVVASDLDAEDGRWDGTEDYNAAARLGRL